MPTQTTLSAIDIMQDALHGVTVYDLGDDIIVAVCSVDEADMKLVAHELTRLADEVEQLRHDLIESQAIVADLDRECEELHRYCERMEAAAYSEGDVFS